MAYYATVTLLVVWGFIALATLFGGIIFWYAVLAVYEQIEEQARSVISILIGAWEAAQPAWEVLRERVRVLARALAFEQLRRS